MINRLKYILLPRKIRKRWSYLEYLYYRMQEMDIASIESIISPKELRELEKRLNSDDYRYIFNSKKEFYKHFDKYIKRDILQNTEYSFEEFLEFARLHQTIIIKPDDMYEGIGIHVLTTQANGFNVQGPEGMDYKPFKEVFDFCKAGNYCVEEYVKGYCTYSNVAPSSLNTIRVTTFIDNSNKARIIFAANQFGYNGSIVDNHEDACIWGLVDIDTGIVTAVDIDAITGNIYDKHPDTGMDIVGFINPFFDDIKRLALDAAGVIPECRLIGWDIAVREDGRIEIIEGNVTPELDLYQAISKMGLRGAFD